MQRPKRQIIKTKPQRPYVIARIIIALLALAAIVAAALIFLTHAHTVHTLSMSGRAHVVLALELAGGTIHQTNGANPAIRGA